MIAHAREKLARKKIDLIVANDVARADAGFEVDTNAATLISHDDAIELPLQSKQEMAGRILDRVTSMLRAAPTRDRASHLELGHMQDASELRRALAAHLDYYRELGIAGISRDPVWTARRVQADADARASAGEWRRRACVQSRSTSDGQPTDSALTEPIRSQGARGCADASTTCGRARDPRLILD